MPRLRGRKVSGEAPEALSDLSSNVWATVRGTAAFMERCGLSDARCLERLRALPNLPECRHEFVARLWALENGLTFQVSTGRVFPDFGRMRGAGIPVMSSTRLRMRLLGEQAEG